MTNEEAPREPAETTVAPASGPKGRKMLAGGVSRRILFRGGVSSS